MSKKSKVGFIIGVFICLTALVIIIIAVFSTLTKPSNPENISFDELVEYFRNEQVVSVKEAGSKVSIVLKSGEEYTHTLDDFRLFQTAVIEKYIIPQHEAGIIKDYNFEEYHS